MQRIIEVQIVKALHQQEALYKAANTQAQELTDLVIENILGPVTSSIDPIFLIYIYKR